MNKKKYSFVLIYLLYLVKLRDDDCRMHGASYELKPASFNEIAICNQRLDLTLTTNSLHLIQVTQILLSHTSNSLYREITSQQPTSNLSPHTTSNQIYPKYPPPETKTASPPQSPLPSHHTLATEHYPQPSSKEDAMSH